MTNPNNDLMRIKYDFNNMMNEYIGEENGLNCEELEKVMPVAKQSFEDFSKNRGKGMSGWSELMYTQNSVVDDILQTAEKVRKDFEYFVILGIGGSALGPIAVFQALKHLRYNELPRKKRGGPKFYVEDNVSPERMASLLDVIEPKKTLFNIVTKSGATAETMSQYLLMYDTIKKAVGKNVEKHFIATTSENSGLLIKIAKQENYKCFYVPDNVGGRFSELSPVGLFPAAVLGIDIRALLKGAEFMDKECSTADIYKNPALAYAVTQYVAMKKGKNISVMMPYSDHLKLMSDWYCQLWAESLGKVNADGENVGQTPAKSVGVTDQHSQLQLYNDGPNDKVVTFIKLEKFNDEVVIPEGLKDYPDVNYLCGHTFNELINVEQYSTEYALTVHKKMNSTISMPILNEYTLGQLMFMMELATAYMGNMLKVNPYDQPGVEAGKKATYALFNRKGFEEKKAELLSAKSKNNRYIV